MKKYKNKQQKATNKTPRNQNDSAWKDIVDAFFPQFMDFFFSDLARKIDWDAGFVMMDKELQEITSNSMTGKRFVDKLVKVTFLNGEKKIILLHIEIQGAQMLILNCACTRITISCLTIINFLFCRWRF